MALMSDCSVGSTSVVLVEDFPRPFPLPWYVSPVVLVPGTGLKTVSRFSSFRSSSPVSDAVLSAWLPGVPSRFSSCKNNDDTM